MPKMRRARHLRPELRQACALLLLSKPTRRADDSKGAQVFDSDGRYLTVFDPGGVALEMVFNDKNELLIVARTKVTKFVINQ